MFHFLDTNIREKKYEMSTQISVHDLRYDVLSKTLHFFLERKYILFSETYVFKIAKDLITFFWPRQILKNKDVPRKKS